MPTEQTVVEQMDEAAAEAAAELKTTLDRMKGEDTADAAIDAIKFWMKKWYIKAGYKRLSKIIINL